MTGRKERMRDGGVDGDKEDKGRQSEREKSSKAEECTREEEKEKRKCRITKRKVIRK